MRAAIPPRIPLALAALLPAVGCGPGSWLGNPFADTGAIRACVAEDSVLGADWVYASRDGDSEPEWVEDEDGEWVLVEPPGRDGDMDPGGLPPGDCDDLQDLDPGPWFVAVRWEDGTTDVETTVVDAGYETTVRFRR